MIRDLVTKAINLATDPGAAKIQGDLPGVEFHDRREHAAQSHHGYPVRSRLLKSVTGFTFHQTACYMGERPERYDGTGAHLIVTRGRKVIWLHDWTHRVVAANGFNNATISLEVDGLYFGDESNPKSVWDNPATPQHETGMDFPDALAETVIQTFSWAYRDALARGQRFTKFMAHRQASGDRRSDPGQLPWQKVALPLMAQLGLDAGPVGFKIDDGLPIPECWDGRAKGIRY